MADKRVYGYCRVSSEEQAAHGISVSAQRDILTGFAAMRQQQIEIFEDAGFSGKNTSRPALRRMLAACASGAADTVVVWKLDRLSRSLRDTLSMIEDIFLPAGISLVSVTESIDTSTPSGRMMLNLLASFAQLEREQDSDRVVMAHKHLAKDCKYLGGHVPLGYMIDDEKHYQLDPVTAPIVRRCFDMYLTRSGYAKILAYLNAPGMPVPQYNKSKLKFMLHNEIYAGTYTRRIGADPRHRVTSPEVIRVPGGVPAILSPEEWAQVCALRDQAARSAALYTARTVYPLSGLVHCAVCGAAMRLNYAGKDRDGTIQRYYQCPSACCRPARLEHMMEIAAGVVTDLAESRDAIVAACAIANHYADLADQDHRQDLRDVEKQIIAINKKIANVLSFIAEHGAAAPASLTEDLQRHEKDKAALENRAAALRRPSARYNTAATVDAITACVGIKKAPPDEQKTLYQKALHKILVSENDVRFVFNWHTGCGDEPPHPVCQSVNRCK